MSREAHSQAQSKAESIKEYADAYADLDDLTVESVNVDGENYEDPQSLMDDMLESLPLAVDARSYWQTAGEVLTADEFRILLCIGPKVEIRGEVDEYGEADKGYLYAQNERVHIETEQQDAIDWFVSHVYISS